MSTHTTRGRTACLLVLTVLALALPSIAHAEHGPTPRELYYANAFADHYGVPRDLVYAIITQESGWNPRAVSSTDAEGIMQLMPATADRFGVQDRFSLVDNLRGGIRYLAVLIRKFGDLREVVAAYYCGGHPIARRHLDYSNPEVVAYVKSVRRIYVRELRERRTPSVAQSTK